MNRFLARLVGAGLLAMIATPSWAVDAGYKGRLAGRGVDGAYYLATDAESVILVDRLETLRGLWKDRETMYLGRFPLAPVEKDLPRCEEEFAERVKSGRLIAVPYNTAVTAVEKEKLIPLRLFSDPQESYGSQNNTTLTKVRVDDGPMQGRELFLADRGDLRSWDLLTEFDRVWIRAQGDSAVPAGLNFEDTEKFWWAYLMRDGATAQALIDAGKIVPVPPGLQGTVTDDKNYKYAEIEVVSDKGPVKIWVMKEVLSLQPPPAPAPAPTP